MGKLLKFIIPLAIFVVLAFVWWNRDPGMVDGQPIKLGAILPLTGPGANVGEIYKNSMEWKVSELQRDGWPIELIIEDSQSDPKMAVAAYNKLRTSNKVKLFTVALSSAVMAVKPLAEKADVLLNAAASSHPETTKDSRHTIRHFNLADGDAQLLADHIVSQGFKRVGVLAQQDEWGRYMRDALAKLLKARGIITYIEDINHKEADFRAPITKLKIHQPQAMVFIAFGKAAGLLIKQVRESGYQGQLYSSLGFLWTPDAYELANQYGRGMYYLSYEDNPKFTAAYRARFNREPAVMAFLPYTDIELLTHAIEQTKSTEPETLISFIKNLKTFEGTYEQVSISPTGDMTFKALIKRWD